MVEKLNIVQSTTEPDKRNIWLKDNELKKFGAKGWSTIGGSNTGGNAGEGINTFEIIVDAYNKDCPSIIVDGETFSTIIEDTSDPKLLIFKVRSRKLFAKLYDVLYNKKCFIIANFIMFSPEHSSPILVNCVMAGSSVLDVIITVEVTLIIKIVDTD